MRISDEKKRKKTKKKTKQSQVVPDLHVDPEGPDVERVDGLPQPGGQVHPVQPTPGPGQEPGGEGAVQRHLQHQTQITSLLLLLPLLLLWLLL